MSANIKRNAFIAVSKEHKKLDKLRSFKSSAMFSSGSFFGAVICLTSATHRDQLMLSICNDSSRPAVPSFIASYLFSGFALSLIF